ncbi:tRNA dimethylallyltransferase, mitochondrial [Paecilomyces lecythidis]|uniref:tRNA dimethylallyltransferase n=1 Tax=Paecilomyces lecythidis TaxID=3004212 RepID=A0ABR3WRV3_9EURO
MAPLITVVGATGTGKSKAYLATRFNGEIINGDAMQMYRGLPIITNQIPVEERNGIPHHMISCIGLEEEPWRVGTFRKESLRLIKEIQSRGKLPILVGGTHYYTQSVLFNDALVGNGSGDEGYVSEKEYTSTSQLWPILDAPAEVMLEKLREVDPVMAERWHPNETRKIRRSLEIFFQTGRPASEIYAEQKRQKQASLLTANDIVGIGGDDKIDVQLGAPGQMRYDTLIFWVHSDREKLRPRLDARVDSMIENGLMSEAQTMSDYLENKESQGIAVDQTRGVWVSIGFKELQPYFTALREGKMSEQELEYLKETCIESVKSSTRQYAVSQIKWIRNKLWNALAEAGMSHRLYVLDASDVDNWTKCVTEPSEQVTVSFLANERCPDPKSLSELAKSTLSAKEQATTPTEVTLRCMTCEVCQKTMTNEEQWTIHINGHAHRRALKYAARRAQKEEYFRQRELSKDNGVKAEG